jgi:transcriptional regulator with XRE-family HTH domain
MAEDEDILVRFGRRLRVLRLGMQLSQEALALECDLDRTYVSGIERGRRNVSLRNITALARVLNVSLSQLFEGVE